MVADPENATSPQVVLFSGDQRPALLWREQSLQERRGQRQARYYADAKTQVRKEDFERPAQRGVLRR